MSNQYMAKVEAEKWTTITIPSGTTVSNAIFLNSSNLSGIITPANLRGVTSITLTHSDKETGTFTPYKDSNSVSWFITLSTSSTLSINPLNVKGLLPWIKFVPNTAPSADLVIETIIGG